MITAKIGEKFVNCFDGEHSRETLKTWADKGILKCPACGKEYEYCHGRVVRPYFRHKEKTDCVDKYSEPETNEHIQGKIALYNWIKDQEGVTDVILEAWIPETRQRPDIAFKYNGEQYVFEFQCSPISTVYLERHELYQAAGINDIWILGTEKYFNKYSRGKYIEQYAIGHYDVNKNCFIDIKDIVTKNDLPYKSFTPCPENVVFDDLMFVGKFKLKPEIIETYFEEDKENCLRKKQLEEMGKKTQIIFDRCSQLHKQYDNLWYKHELSVFYGTVYGLNDDYRVGVRFWCKYTGDLYFFIHTDRVDICNTYEYKKPYYGTSSKGYGRVRKGWSTAQGYNRIDQFEYKDLDELYFKITDYIGNKIRTRMYGLDWRNDING